MAPHALWTPRSYPTTNSAGHPDHIPPPTLLDTQIISHHPPCWTPRSYPTTHLAGHPDHIPRPTLLDTQSYPTPTLLDTQIIACHHPVGHQIIPHNPLFWTSRSYPTPHSSGHPDSYPTPTLLDTRSYPLPPCRTPRLYPPPTLLEPRSYPTTYSAGHKDHSTR
ncbi:hypothetical protein CHS0354_036480, partial [Potamilus streckersoni]